MALFPTVRVARYGDCATAQGSFLWNCAKASKQKRIMPSEMINGIALILLDFGLMANTKKEPVPRYAKIAKTCGSLPKCCCYATSTTPFHSSLLVLVHF
jgi:hypothetical protein